MKILQEKYPKGSLGKQQTAGRYIDGYLYENIDVLAKNIKRDMTFLGVISSSTLEVGTGKSVFVQQVAEAWGEQVKKHHGIDVPFGINNIVFKPEDLIDRAQTLPKYSCIILDEWEDLHYWSTMGKTLRQFFRKCRQLNLFMLVIIPNFFQLDMGYAISRSAFFIDVKFKGEFERGHFSFYSFGKKKDLYIKGKKTMNYSCVRPNFEGVFLDGYVVDEKVYRETKLRDLAEKEELIKPNAVRRSVFYDLYFGLKGLGLTDKDLAKGFGVKDRTVYEWKAQAKELRPEFYVAIHNKLS